MLPFDEFRDRVPYGRRHEQRAEAGKTAREACGKHAPIDRRAGSVPGKQTVKDRKAKAARKCELDEQSVIVAAHGVAAAIEAGMGQ